MFRFLFFIILFAGLPYANAKDIKNININKVQNIVAPALIPAKARSLRSAREDAELETESVIMQRLEKERLRDEQKRLQKMFNKEEGTTSKKYESSASQEANPVAKPYIYNNWLNKAYISFGVGTVNYLGVENISSTESPAYFFSFGGYGSGKFIFDTIFSYSTHYLNPLNDTSLRLKLSQPGVALAFKFSPLKDRIKPYFGVSSSFVARRWSHVTPEGEYFGDAQSEDVAVKKWRNSLDVGIALGADIGLANKLGLNLDIRYYVNAYTETRKTDGKTTTDLLDERPSVALSVNLRYYF